MQKKYNVTVLGAGNMGTAIAQVAAKNGHQVNLWNYEGDRESLKQIQQFGENKKYLAGIKLSVNVLPIFNLEEAIKSADIIFFVLPSIFIEDLIKKTKIFLKQKTICVDVSKGLDEKKFGLISDFFSNNLPVNLFASISGPAIAFDMATGGFTAMNIASTSAQAIKITKQVLESENLKLFKTTDIIGVELVGSFKNVYAIALGMCDCLKMAMNVKAALLVFALKEISLLVNKMGGKIETVYDLAGLGDLIGTGLCVSSRNHRFGEYLAQGLNKKKALYKVGQVVEGVGASKILYLLSRRYHIKMPLASMIYDVIIGKSKPQVALFDFLKKLS
jgi:glycerol-3-phosphate dehydrogenase (NAD(P)+)